MKSLVVFESVFGNTEVIATAIAKSIEGKLVRVEEVNMNSLKSLDLLIVGSPVHGGRATFTIDDFLKRIPPDSLKQVNVATFDTRFAPEDHGIGIKILINIIRFAAERIAKELVKKGGILIVKPEGFIVNDKEGPLRKGEELRAKVWAKAIAKSVMKKFNYSSKD